MSAFTFSFVFTMFFIVTIGIGAIIFISFDEETTPKTKPSTTQRLYNIVRRINTETIETVDSHGDVQQWTRSI